MFKVTVFKEFMLSRPIGSDGACPMLITVPIKGGGHKVFICEFIAQMQFNNSLITELFSALLLAAGNVVKNEAFYGRFHFKNLLLEFCSPSLLILVATYLKFSK